MARHEYRAVVFDFYNTLVRIDTPVPTAAQVLENMGYRCPEVVAGMWSSDAFDGQTHPAADAYEQWHVSRLTQLCLSVGVAAEEAPDIAKLLRRRDMEWTVRPLPDAERTLRLARSLGLRVGLCSNWDYEIGPYLARAGLAGFDAVITSREAGARKPHRIPFEMVATALAVPAESVVFVGDSLLADITGAVHAGMGAIWVAGASEVLLPGRLWQVRDLAEAGRRLQSLRDAEQD
jgi:HAD superfamily hydrolase (TIGR01549 family)